MRVSTRCRSTHPTGLTCRRQRAHSPNLCQSAERHFAPFTPAHFLPTSPSCLPSQTTTFWPPISPISFASHVWHSRGKAEHYSAKCDRWDLLRDCIGCELRHIDGTPGCPAERVVYKDDNVIPTGDSEKERCDGDSGVRSAGSGRRRRPSRRRAGGLRSDADRVVTPAEVATARRRHDRRAAAAVAPFQRVRRDLSVGLGSGRRRGLHRRLDVGRTAAWPPRRSGVTT